MDLEVTSIEEIESRLISKPREEFLNYNFLVQGALCANQSSSIASRVMSECRRSRAQPLVHLRAIAPN